MASARAEPGRGRIRGALPLPRTPSGVAITIGVLALTALSVRGTGFDLLELIAGAGPIERFVSELFPPDVSQATLRTVGRGVVETFYMSFLGAGLGTVMAVPLAVLGTTESTAVGERARRSPRRLAYHAARLVLNVFRSVPDILWALVFVVALGLGPFPGTMALAVHSAGVLGKLFSEALETVPVRPVAALAAMGATPFARLIYGRVPQAAAASTSLVLYQWECNIRSAAILGFVGAGGIGQEILVAVNLFDYPRVATLVGATVIVVLVVDRLSALLRARMAT